MFMEIVHFTAAQIIDREKGFFYRILNTSSNVRTLHTHEYYELQCVIKGTLKHSFADGTTHHLPVGSFLLIRPEDVHVCRAATEEECEFIMIVYSVETLQELFSYLGKGFRPERLLESQYPPVYSLSEVERLHFLHSFQQVAALPLDQQELIKTLLRSLLMEFLLLCFPVQPLLEERGEPEWLREVYYEMQKKDNFILGTQRMVELSGRSHHHLCREFKRYFQQTPTDYIIGLRLNYAANLLIHSSKSVTDIAMDLHFQNLSYFHQRFKRQFGMSPAQFRKGQRA
ncbi:MAG: AraC family transcriptional regulator [Paenibacillaceae bacterium]|nr:AraC family transcriptional regulator [Paenibacillaceae bacterium]